MELEARVLALQDANELNAWQLICGYFGGEHGHRIFAIEGTHPVDLAREFRTGSHNLWSSRQTETVCAQLAMIFELVPFRPFFVDDAGYKCRFVQPISRQHADAIESILTVGLEGYVSRWTGRGPILADAVLADNGLRLWWAEVDPHGGSWSFHVNAPASEFPTGRCDGFQFEFGRRENSALRRRPLSIFRDSRQ